ncbi:17407_t:CDS:1, partial [Acaulospora morrowiae]
SKGDESLEAATLIARVVEHSPTLNQQNFNVSRGKGIKGSNLTYLFVDAVKARAMIHFSESLWKI